MREPACLIFDLFGTLVDYEADRSNLHYRHCHEKSGCTTGYDAFVAAWEAAFQQHEQASRDSGREFHMHAVAARVCEMLQLPPDKSQALTDDFIEDWLQGVRQIPGAGGLLRRLGSHYRLGLISNTHYPPMVHALLKELGITDVLEVVVLSAEVGVPKPDAVIFEDALTKLAVSAEQSVYIGDSFEADFLGARGVGMDCYLIGSHARVPKDRQLRSIMDLPIYFNTGSSR